MDKICKTKQKAAANAEFDLLLYEIDVQRNTGLNVSAPAFQLKQSWKQSAREEKNDFDVLSNAIVRVRARQLDK
jgi:hypothetical protein